MAFANILKISHHYLFNFVILSCIDRSQKDSPRDPEGTLQGILSRDSTRYISFFSNAKDRDFFLTYVNMYIFIHIVILLFYYLHILTLPSNEYHRSGTANAPVYEAAPPTALGTHPPTANLASVFAVNVLTTL